MQTKLKPFFDVLNFLDRFITQFNQKNPHMPILLGLKGSFILVEQNIVDKKINDLDFFFIYRNYGHNRAFVEQLLTQPEISLLKKDENLVIMQVFGINIEFILFETIALKFVESVKYLRFIQFLKIEFAILQKLFSISYIASKYFPHDKEKKINEYLIFLESICLNGRYNQVYAALSNNFDFCVQQLYNSFFIYKYYKYVDMLDFSLDPKDPVLTLPQYHLIWTKIKPLFEMIMKFDPRISQLHQISQKFLVQIAQFDTVDSQLSFEKLSDLVKQLNIPINPHLQYFSITAHHDWQQEGLNLQGEITPNIIHNLEQFRIPYNKNYDVNNGIDSNANNLKMAIKLFKINTNLKQTVLTKNIFFVLYLLELLHLYAK